METLEEIGELALLRRLKPYLTHPFLPHDDASAFRIDNANTILTNIDGFVKDSDMLPGMTYYHAGYKAALMATSDLVVKGVTPLFLLASFNVPKTMTWAHIKQFMDGLTSFTTGHDIAFLGGDFNSTSHDEVFDITVTGVSPVNAIIPRKGGAPGDLIITKPSFGWTTLAYHHLLEGHPITDPTIKNTTLTWAYTPPYDVHNELRALRSLHANASIDSSDGLIRSLYELANINNYGFKITTLPISPVLAQYLKSKNLSLEEYAFYGGEEFTPILVIPQNQANQIPDSYMIIGEVIEEQGVFYASKSASQFIPNRGWEHFQT